METTSILDQALVAIVSDPYAGLAVQADAWVSLPSGEDFLAHTRPAGDGFVAVRPTGLGMEAVMASLGLRLGQWLVVDAGWVS